MVSVLDRVKHQEGSWAWTGSVGFPPCRVWVPEVRLDHVPAGCKTEPLRGSAHTLAVFRGSTCIGWTLKHQDCSTMGLLDLLAFRVSARKACYRQALEQGASRKQASQHAARAWMWVDDSGRFLPLSNAPRCGSHPAWRHILSFEALNNASGLSV